MKLHKRQQLNFLSLFKNQIYVQSHKGQIRGKILKTKTLLIFCWTNIIKSYSSWAFKGRVFAAIFNKIYSHSSSWTFVSETKRKLTWWTTISKRKKEKNASLSLKTAPIKVSMKFIESERCNYFKAEGKKVSQQWRKNFSKNNQQTWNFIWNMAV